GKGQSKYDLSVYGPNGYFRLFKGSVESWEKANLSVDTHCESDHGLTLDLRNKGRETARVRIFDAYTKRTLVRAIAARQNLVCHWSLEDSYGWYDLSIAVESDPSFKQQLAGHIETGKDSMSDPLLGA
ncbi:MAG TPA: phospholipase domain-containing protein, partial [Polyangiaceae bacterium]